MSTANNCKILVTIPDQNEELLNALTIKFHFEYFTGMGSIEKVQLLPPNKAVVTFKDPQGVKRVLDSKKCCVLGDKTVVIDYFMEKEVNAHQPPPSNNLDEPPVCSAPVFNCHPVQHPLEDTKAEWLQGKLKELNDCLLAVKAKASVTHFGPPLVTITPLSGAERLADWDQQVDRVFQTFVTRYKEYSQDLPEYHRDNILKYAESARGPDLIVKCDNRVLRIAGDSGKVDEVEDAICRLFQVRTEEKKFPKRYIRYLQRFSLLGDLPVQDYKLSYDQELVQVDANEEGLKSFWACVDSDIVKMQEKSLVLTPAAFTLLSSARGATKILEILGTHQVEYDLSDSDDPPTLYLLSPQRDARLKTIKEAIRKYMYFEDLPIQDPSKFRYCSDIQWKEMVDKLQEDVFAIVTVDQATHSVIVTGEKVVVSNVIQRIKHFLTEQTSVQEQVVIQSQRWSVISKGFGNKIADIKQGVSKEVTITWPQRPTATQAKVTVSIKGSPAEVDRVKGEIEALEKRVCCKEVKVCNIPAALQVVDSMEDKFRALESHYGASIEATLTRDDDTPSGQASAQPTAVCSATCSNGVRIYVYTGNFTKHSFVDAVVNFLRPNSDFQEENTKQLFAAGGVALKEDLGKKMSQFFKQAPGDVFKSHHGKLQCNQLYHCFALQWAGGNDGEEYYLMDSLAKIFSNLRSFNQILFTSICSAPLKYPADVFARSVISAVQMNPSVASELTVAVYVSDLAQAQEFVKQLKNSGCRMTEISSSTLMSSPIQQQIVRKKGSGSTRLSVVKSDISKEAVDVIVNTTTAEMKLNMSAVSKAILGKAGPMLQQACDLLIQGGLKLDHGQIVDTKSYGSLRCKKIIHAHVPPRSEAVKSGKDHHTLIMEIVLNCLEMAESENMKSISFPAFGFGHGGYSLKEVAKPMLTAFRNFGHQGPRSLETIKVVIFDPTLHQLFYNFFVKFFNIDLSIPQKVVSRIYNILGAGAKADTGRSVELQDGSASVPVRQHYQIPTTNQVLVFTIFAATKDKCDQIEAKLRDGIKEKAEVRSIENPVIADLIDSDIEELKKIGDRFQVEVKVLTWISKVEIQGEKCLVKVAEVEIVQVIADIEKTKSELKRFQWQNESSSGEVEKYSDKDSFKLERAKAKGLSCLVMVIEGFEVVIDLDRMEERNKDSGDVRKVIRTPIKPQDEILLQLTVNLPKTWEPQPVDSDGKEEPMHMFDVVKDSPEYQEALKRFHETIGQTVTIVSLKRIQNPVEYGKHVSLRELIAKKYQTKTPSIRQLFHGSSETCIQLIAVQGFNRSYAGDANATNFGRGVYFAANASYSALSKYAMPDKDGNQSMFICQVILGKYTQGMQGAKAAAQANKVAYDTLVDKLDNPTIFVAMSDAQAYPEYLVTFKVQKGKK